MPYDNANVQWLQGIKGLNETVPPGSRRQIGLTKESISPVTPDLLNVRVRFGNVQGRGGMTPYFGLANTTDYPLNGVFAYNRAIGSNNTLIRITSSSLQKHDPAVGAVWTNVTGDPINMLDNSLPDFTIQNDILVFTTEGRTRPMGYGSNTGVNVDYPTTTTLGGVPPYAKCLTSYMQFLLLGNVSNDGTFNDVFDGWRLIEYSDNPFVSWTACGTNTIDLYQTPGSLVRMKPLGRVCMCYKDDGVIRLTWIGGSIKFTQELIPGSVGCLAPMSVADLGNFGHAYLGTNAVIYHVTQSAINAVAFEELSESLPLAQTKGRLRWSRGFAIPSKDLYVLLYDRTGLFDVWLDSYITWNYRTGEVTHGTLGLLTSGGDTYRRTDFSTEVAVVGALDPLSRAQIEEFDSTVNTATDDGVSIDRYWTSGWQQLADEEGYLYGVVVEMRKSARARVRISVARDMIPTFGNEQVFSLKSIDPRSDIAECSYRFPSPIFGSWFNVKIRFLHDSPTATTDMLRVGFIGRPVHKYPSSPQRVASSAASSGTA